MLKWDDIGMKVAAEEHLARGRRKKKKKRLVLLGLTYGLFSGFFFAMSAAIVKYLERLDAGQVALYQYVAITALSLPMVVQCGRRMFGDDWGMRGWFLLSGVFDALTVYFAFISFRLLPLSDASALTSSVPVFVTIAARVCLREHCNAAQVVAIAVSVLGVAFVSRVPLLFSPDRDAPPMTRARAVGLGVAMASIATESGVYVVLRRLHGANVYVILFNFGLVATAVNAALAALSGRFERLACGGVEAALVVALGGVSFLTQLTLTRALEIEDAGPVSVLMAAGDIFLSFVLDVVMFHEEIDAYTIVGATLVIISVVLIGFKSYLDSRLLHKVKSCFHWREN